MRAFKVGDKVAVYTGLIVTHGEVIQIEKVADRFSIYLVCYKNGETTYHPSTSLFKIQRDILELLSSIEEDIETLKNIFQETIVDLHQMEI